MTRSHFNRAARALTLAALPFAILEVAVPERASPAVSADVEKLPLRRSVLLPDGSPGGRAWIVEDSALAAGAAAGFADVRLMDATGAAVPLDRSVARRTDTIGRPWRSWPLRWTAGDHGERWMTLDLGEGAPMDLVLEAFGPSTNASFRVMGSADSVEWFVLPQNYDPWRPRPGGEDSTPGFRTRLSEVRRYLRFVQDAGFPAPAPQDEVRLSERSEQATPRESLGFRVAQRFLPGSNDRFEIVVTLTGAARAVTRIDLESATPARASFSFELETRLPRGGWQYHAPDETPTWGGGSRDSLVFFPARTTELRIRVNGADAPNEPVRVTGVWAAPDRFGFTPIADASYWLGFGDPYLAAREDVAVDPGVHDPADAEAPRHARLGPVEPNPFHRAPGFGLEWLKRRPVVLSVAMVAILGLVALLARRPAAPR
jgi:hypothetical protein